MILTCVWNLLKWLNQQAVWWERSVVPVDLQQNAEWFKGSIQTHIWKLPHQRLQLSDAALLSRLRNFPPMGDNPSREVLKWKMPLCKKKKSWNAPSDSRGVNVWGRDYEMGTGGGVSEGAVRLVLYCYLILQKCEKNINLAKIDAHMDAGRAWCLMMKAFITVRSSQACRLCI